MIGIIRKAPCGSSTPTFTFDNSAIIQMCSTAGYWKGLLQLFIFANRWQEAMLLAFELDDRVSFDLITATSHITTHAWTALLGLIKRKESNSSASSSNESPSNLEQARFEPDISMELVVDKMCAAIGPQSTLSLLKSVFSNEQEMDRLVLQKLSQRMFKRILEYGRVNLIQRRIAHDVLEVVDSYLWSLKTDAMSPPFRAIEQLETQVRHFCFAEHSIAADQFQIPNSKFQINSNADYMTIVWIKCPLSN